MKRNWRLSKTPSMLSGEEDIPAKTAEARLNRINLGFLPVLLGPSRIEDERKAVVAKSAIKRESVGGLKNS